MDETSDVGISCDESSFDTESTDDDDDDDDDDTDDDDDCIKPLTRLKLPSHPPDDDEAAVQLLLVCPIEGSVSLPFVLM